jgi:hypothetical protein
MKEDGGKNVKAQSVKNTRILPMAIRTAKPPSRPDPER